jgi:hypothetical protein
MLRFLAVVLPVAEISNGHERNEINDIKAFKFCRLVKEISGIRIGLIFVRYIDHISTPKQLFGKKTDYQI